MTNKLLSRQCGRRHERFCDRPPPSTNRPLAHPPRQPSPISSHLEPSTRNGIVTVIASGRLVRGGGDCAHEPAPRPALPPPLLRRDHQPCRLAVSRVQPQPSGR